VSLLGLVLAWVSAAGAQVPATTRQLVTTWVSDVDSSHGMVRRWERRGSAWVSVGDEVPVRLGRAGVAWGRGLHPLDVVEPVKVEGDGRAPMGLFALGPAFRDPPAPPSAHGWPVHEVTVRDLWVEDPEHPAYNTHLRVPEGQAMTAWEVSQRMRLGDPAHRLKVVVGHNIDPPMPGEGSAIFLHIWRRDGEAPTAGCTAMPAADLEALVDWLDPTAHPVYALLTPEAWGRWGPAWGLPAWDQSGTEPAPEGR